MEHPASLLIAWRERATHLEQFGDPNSARLWNIAAAELERALQALGDETLTLTEAAAASGYTAAHLGHLVATGKLTNYGRRHAPRVRRADLPTKSPTRPGRPAARATPLTKFKRR